MGTKTKIATAAVVLALLCLATWRALPERSPAKPEASMASTILASEQAPAEMSSAPAATRTNAAEAPLETGLRISVDWGRADAPAVGIGVRTRLWRESGLVRQWEDLTDTAGLVTKHGLRPGSYVVACDRNTDTQRIEVESGRVASARFSLRLGLDVSGLVVDSEQHPVPGAGIDISGIMWPEGHIAQHADAQGRFHVEDLSPGQLLGARLDGYEPSLVRQLDGTPGDNVAVTLVLSRGGASVAGQVRGPDGEAVAGARIEITGPGGDGIFRLADGSRGGHPRAATAESATDGTFHIGGLAPGGSTIRVLAEDRVPWLGSREFAPGATTSLDVCLGRGATLSGSVTCANGDPATGAWVQIQCGREARTMIVDATGNYSSTPLPGGTYSLTVDGEGRGHVKSEIQLLEGESKIWSAKLNAGNTYGGRLVDEGGSPLVDWYAIAVQTDSTFYGNVDAAGHLVEEWLDWWGRAKTDIDGRFCISNLPKGMPFQIEIRRPREQMVKPPVRVLEDQQPNGPETTIVVREADLKVGTVSGVLTDTQGNPITDAALRLDSVPIVPGPSGPSARPENPGGKFVIREVPSGRWRLHVEAPGYDCSLDSFRLESGQELDLGRVELRKADAGLVVTFTRVDGAWVGRPDVQLYSASGEFLSSLILEGNQASSHVLQAGEYLLRIVVDGHSFPSRQVTLRDGEQTKLEIELPALPK